MFYPVVYLISGFRWSFAGRADVHIAISIGMTFGTLMIYLGIVWWLFRTGCKLRN